MEGRDEWVVLNVGGTRYETYTSTLCKYQPTMLSSMFRPRDDSDVKIAPVRRSANGEYLLDRNGRAFEAVLEFLRSGLFFVPPGVSEALVEAE